MGVSISEFRGEYYFLSNFYSAPVTYNGMCFENNEAAFQAAKCPERMTEFCRLNPSEAKRLGRRVKLRGDWEAVKDMSTAQKDAWDELLHGKTSDEDAEVEVEDVPATKLDEAASKQSMDMKRFSLCFNGRIDVNMIANSLLHILGDNAVGEVEIVCNLG